MATEWMIKNFRRDWLKKKRKAKLRVIRKRS